MLPALNERESLPLATVRGDMRDLSVFGDASFGLVVHPISNLFVPILGSVWSEAFRVLEPGGRLLAGFTNPLRYLFGTTSMETGDFRVEHSLPYSDLDSLPPERLARLTEQEEPLEFGHTLEDQIGGQLAAGFVITGFYEDRYDEGESDPLSEYLPTFIATRAVKSSAKERATSN